MQYYRAYLLIFLYLTTAFRPVMPVWKDAVAHFFDEMEHFATVHQANGDDHVHEEVKKATDDQQDSGKQAATQTEPVSAHWPVYITCILHALSDPLRIYPLMASVLSTTFLSIQIPPPKQLPVY